MKTLYITSLALLVAASIAAEELVIYSSEEFKFAAKLPKETIESKARHTHGLLGSFKGVDVGRKAIYSVSVNVIDAFVAEPSGSNTDWKALVKENFLGWAKGMKPVTGTLKYQSAKWSDCDAIRFSFQTEGFVSENVGGFHHGIHLVHQGAFYSLSVISLIDEKEASEDARKLEESFIILESIRKKTTR
jgi:hypothetical protein